MFRTISNKITALAVGITMLIVVTLGSVSYLFTRWNMQDQIIEKLTFEVAIVQNRLEAILSTINHEVKNLSENLVMINALIDSEGRDIYIDPFMKGYKLPYAFPFILTLYDFEGKPVTTSQLEMQAYTDKTTLKAVIEGKQTLAEIRQEGDEKKLSIIYPVIYSYTGLPEGMLVLTVPCVSIVDIAFHPALDDAGKMFSLSVNGQEIWQNSLRPQKSHSISSNLNLEDPLSKLALRIKLGESEEKMYAPLHKLTIIYVILGIAVLLVTIAMSRFVAYRLTLPLQSLTEATNNIALTGLPDGQINIASDDEVKKLTFSFNTMLDRLRDSQTSLENRVQERTRELEVVNQKLQHYGDTRDVLLLEVNHRVKNNLIAIISMLHQEEDRAEADNADGRSDSGGRLNEIITRISSLLTVHSLLSSTQWEPLPLSQLSESIIQQVFKGVPVGKSINFAISPSNVHISSDQAHYLAIVLNELATNTMKYAFNGKDTAQAQISINIQDNSICLGYCDDGPGYPEPILRREIPKNCIGFQLILGIISKSLQGKIDLMNENGAMARIIFPAMTSESENEGSNHG